MRAIVIYPDGRIEPQDIDGFHDLKEILNDGYLETVSLGQATAYLDEDGKFKNAPANEIAEIIIRKMLQDCGRTLLCYDYIVGTVVFLGEKWVGLELQSTDLPENVIRLIENITGKRLL